MGRVIDAADAIDACCRDDRRRQARRDVTIEGFGDPRPASIQPGPRRRPRHGAPRDRPRQPHVERLHASTCATPTARVEGTPSSVWRTPRKPPSIRWRLPGPKPGDGELCAAPANQNCRGNGVRIWNSVTTIAGNVIRDTRDGIYSFVDRSTVRDNDIARVRYGLHYIYRTRTGSTATSSTTPPGRR
jgi:hypothetical protein